MGKDDFHGHGRVPPHVPEMKFLDWHHLSVDFLPATISGLFLELELASGAMAHKSNPYKKVEG